MPKQDFQAFTVRVFQPFLLQCSTDSAHQRNTSNSNDINVDCPVQGLQRQSCTTFLGHKEYSINEFMRFVLMTSSVFASTFRGAQNNCNFFEDFKGCVAIITILFIIESYIHKVQETYKQR